MFPDFLTGNDFARAISEIFQKAVFPLREDDFPLSSGDALAVKINDEISDFDGGLSLSVDLPSLGLDAGKEFGKAKGLDEVVIGSSIESLDAILHRIEGAGNNDGGFIPIFSEFGQNLESIDAGNHEVEHDGVVFMTGGKFESLVSVGCRVDGKACIFKVFRDRFTKGSVVFNQEDAHGKEYKLRVRNEIKEMLKCGKGD